ADRPEADSPKPGLQPGGRRAIADAGDEPAAEHAAGFGLAGGKAQLDTDRAGTAGRWLGRNGVVDQRAEAEGGEIAGNAMNAGTVAAIGGDGDIVDDAAKPGEVDI